MNGIGCATFDTLPVEQLKYIQHDLLDKWPNLRNAEKSGKRCFHNGAELFWAQNWCEHGSVTKKFKNPADYFTEAVDVANKWDLKTILKWARLFHTLLIHIRSRRLKTPSKLVEGIKKTNFSQFIVLEKGINQFN